MQLHVQDSILPQIFLSYIALLRKVWKRHIHNLSAEVVLNFSHYFFFLIMILKEGNTLWICCSDKNIWNSCWHLHVSMMLIMWNEMTNVFMQSFTRERLNTDRSSPSSELLNRLIGSGNRLKFWFWFTKRNAKRLGLVCLFVAKCILL